ncbi:MAG: hypothetical protein ACRDVE_15335, partial [Actinocrinis sp.]
REAAGAWYGEPVMRGRMLSEVRSEWNEWHDGQPAQAPRARKVLPRPDGSVVVIDDDGHITVRRAVSRRSLGTLPRREPMRCEPGHPPWATGEMPAYRNGWHNDAPEVTGERSPS